MAKKEIKIISSCIKPVGLIVWFAIITFIATLIHLAGMETNPNGETCNYNIWAYGNIYNWIWNKNPCVFTSYFLMGYILYTQLYLLYDYIRRKIVCFNPKINWRMAEVGVWFAVNWGHLLMLTAKDYGTLDWTMGWTSFAGTLLFFVPIILLAGGVRFLNNRTVLWIFFGILLVYIGLAFVAATI